METTRFASGQAPGRELQLDASSLWDDPDVAEIIVVLAHGGPPPFNSLARPINMCVHRGHQPIKVYAFPSTAVPGRSVELSLALDSAVLQAIELLGVEGPVPDHIKLPYASPYIQSIFCARMAVGTVAAVDDPTGAKHARAAMDIAVSAIKRVLHAYLIASEDTRIDFGSLRQFGQFAYLMFIDSSGHLKHARPFTVWREPSHTIPRDVASRLDDGIATEGVNHPIDQVVLWRLQARRAYDVDRDDVTALIFLNTSIESLIGAVYRAMLRDDQRANSSRVRVDLDLFKPRIRAVGEALRGGRWDPDDTNSPVGRYWHRLYELRGRIVHGGYRPSSTETEQAFESGGELRDELERRIIEARDRFPVTCLLLNSRQSLQDRGLYSRRVRQTHEDLVTNEEPHIWFLPH